ncbi:transposase [Bdellovibrio sp. KM01]|uniref:transposase n=1 Tax=Bdellovibrio sp. KM01 TaxID=2748865 RepID=UPI0015EAEB31|nr:transposase [Bdellovibrio sp. KM01]QLY25849.1 transposase [Bdellovibrio sp. KM01]
MAWLIMPRKKFQPNSEFPYHVRARTTNKDWFELPLDVVWSIFADYLHFLWRAYDVRIHSFVLMNNHFHMIVSTPDANLDEAMNYLMREVSKRIGERVGRINQIFGGPYKWSLIKDDIYLHHAYKYIYRNPVDAGMISRVEEYPFSTLRGLLGLDYLHIPTYDPLDIGRELNSQLNWLNQAYAPDERETIKKALSKKEFRFTRDDKTRKMPIITIT